MEIKDAIHLVEVQSRILGQPLLETLMFMNTQRDEYTDETLIALDLVLAKFTALFAKGEL